MIENRTKVLRIIARMNIGGPAIQITGLMKNLSSLSFEQVLLTGHCQKNEVDYLIEKGIELSEIRLDGFGRSIDFFTDIKVFFTIRRVIKNFNPDIIHTHTAKAGFLGRLAAISTFRRQIRVHTYHGHLLRGYFGALKTKLIIWIESRLASHTNSLIAVGVKVRDDLIDARIGVSKQYEVIGPGLEIGELPDRSLVLQLFGIPKDKFIVTWIGRVVPVKAPHRIIEIARQCKARDVRAHFVVAGDGPLLNDLKSQARLSNLPITFLGWQSEIEAVLGFSDLVLLTSENEGTPTALIQAQMAGIPVLTTDEGSASEVMIHEKTGFCLKYGARAFADKIELLIKDPQLRVSFGIDSKKNALEKFSLSRLVHDHETLYRKLIKQSNF